MWQLRSQGGVRFAPFRGWWPPCHFTPFQKVFPPAKAAAKYAIRMKTPQHLPVWVSLRSFTRKGRFQEKLSQVETQGISVQKSFSWRNKTKDGKGLKPEDVYRLYGYSYGSSILDSWDSQEGAERTVRVLETSVPWPECDQHICQHPCQHIKTKSTHQRLADVSVKQNPSRFRQVLQGVAHCHRTLVAIPLDQGVVAVTGQIIYPRMGRIVCFE